MAISLQAGPGNNSGSILADGQTVLTFNTTTGVSGVLAPNTVSTASIQNNSVTPNKLSQTPGVGLSSEGFPVITTDTYVGGFKNFIINGDMRIDQRYAGTQQTFINPGTQRIIDKFRFGGSAGGNGESAGDWLTQQLSAGGPDQFPYYTRLQVINPGFCLSGDGVGQYFTQTFEGNNIINLGWGTLNAKPCTLSFWVRSSIPGLYCLELNNGKGTLTGLRQEYQTVYTINNANIWEYKTITIQPPTQGIFADLTDITGFGLRVDWELGSLSAGNIPTPPRPSLNTWLSIPPGAGISLTIAAGAVQFFQNLNATFDITGVQLEVGNQATAFEHRPIGTELALCQRYYQKSYPYSVVPGTSAVGYTDPYSEPITGVARGALASHELIAIGTGAVHNYSLHSFPVQMRATPTLTFYHPGYGSSLGNNTTYVSGISSIDFSVPCISKVIPFSEPNEKGIPVIVAFNLVAIDNFTAYTLLSAHNGGQFLNGTSVVYTHYTAEAEL
jgi:hypothetical protein